MPECCLCPKCRRAETALEQSVGLDELCAGGSHRAFAVSSVFMNQQCALRKTVPPCSVWKQVL